MKMPCEEGVELKKKTMKICFIAKIKTFEHKNLLKTDPTKFGKIFEKGKKFLS